ncbi:hypothetical protein BC833DRAFT_603592, partial [Globomyces pollinis-pini]
MQLLQKMANQPDGSIFPTQAKIYDTGFDTVHTLILTDTVLAEEIDRLSKLNQTVCAQEIMDGLSKVASQLKLAHHGTKGLKANIHILELLCQFQSVLKEFHFNSKLIVEESILACRSYQRALLMLKNPTVAIKLIASTSKSQERIATTAEKLFDSCQTIIKFSMTILCSEIMLELKERRVIDVNGLEEAFKSFDQAALLWISIKNHCLTLNSNKIDLQVSELNSEMLEGYIRGNGMNWLTFAHMNYIASKAIGNFAEAVDGILNNLPSHHHI